MRDDLRQLYQEVILDHSRSPRNFRRPAQPTCQAEGNNPMCGDALSVFLVVDDHDVIEDAAFQGQGCAISLASASLMTEILKGRTVAEAERLSALPRLRLVGTAPVKAAIASFVIDGVHPHDIGTILDQSGIVH